MPSIKPIQAFNSMNPPPGPESSSQGTRTQKDGSISWLFKFCTAEGARRILEKNTIFVTSPLDLNDPFEMRPAWTDNHEERSRRDEAIRNRMLAGHPLLGGAGHDTSASPQGKVDSQVGIADFHNEQIFAILHARFRILSFCTGVLDNSDRVNDEADHSTLMWSHYANQFQGVCLGIDASAIYNGIHEGGFRVQYDPARRCLPASIYDCWHGLSEEMENNAFKQDQESGLYLTSEDRAELERQRYVRLLTYKSPVWSYEHEIRMLYEMPNLERHPSYRRVYLPCEVCRMAGKGADNCKSPLYRDGVELPRQAIRCVIFGSDCRFDDTNSILDLVANSDYSHVHLYWTALHSRKYTVQYVRQDDEYIRFIQEQRGKHVAGAKRHLRNRAEALNYIVTRKGECYDFSRFTGPCR